MDMVGFGFPGGDAEIAALIAAAALAALGALAGISLGRAGRRLGWFA
jgi:hypothetical protein